MFELHVSIFHTADFFQLRWRKEFIILAMMALIHLYLKNANALRWFLWEGWSLVWSTAINSSCRWVLHISFHQFHSIVWENHNIWSWYVNVLSVSTAWPYIQNMIDWNTNQIWLLIHELRQRLQVKREEMVSCSNHLSQSAMNMLLWTWRKSKSVNKLIFTQLDDKFNVSISF